MAMAMYHGNTLPVRLHSVIWRLLHFGAASGQAAQATWVNMWRVPLYTAEDEDAGPADAFAQLQPAIHQNLLSLLLRTAASTPHSESPSEDDADPVTSLVEALDGALTGFLSVETNFGEIVPLCPGGHSIPLLSSTTHAFVRLYRRHYFETSIGVPLRAILTGLFQVLPPAAGLIPSLTPSDFELAIAGPSELDVEDWYAHTNAQSLSPILHGWFWSVVRKDLTPAQRVQLLKFATGKAAAPVGGFKHLNPRFTLTGSGHASSSLPVAHTCGHELEIPRYRNRAQMKEKILYLLEIQNIPFHIL